MVSVRLQPRLYSPGATSGWSILLIWSVWLIWSVCLVWSICWSVCWLVYWFGWSGVWGLLVSSVLEVWAGGWSGLSIAVSVGLLVWVTIVVTHGDLATDSSIKIFAGCWFG